MNTLTVNKTKDGEKMTAELIGRVDVMTSPQFEKEVMSDLDGINELVLDLRKLQYISSAGLRVIVMLQQTISSKKGNMTLRNVSEGVLDILTATGLTDVLNIE